MANSLSLIEPMNWLDRCLSKHCVICRRLFKGEFGWKAVVMSMCVGGLVTHYFCTRCCSTQDHATEMLEWV